MSGAYARARARTLGRGAVVTCTHQRRAKTHTDAHKERGRAVGRTAEGYGERDEAGMMQEAAGSDEHTLTHGGAGMGDARAEDTPS